MTSFSRDLSSLVGGQEVGLGIFNETTSVIQNLTSRQQIEVVGQWQKKAATET